MDKMKFETPDMAQMNVEKIAALFPNCVTESKAKDGKLKKAVNFDALKQMLGESVAEGDESYEFTWVGKRDAMVEAAKPIRKTLRPCVEESKNFDATENLYIEGDNLEALKLLQEGYLGKVKMIYIDPPYNTGNDFIYKDDFCMDSAKYSEESGAVDDEGNRMVQNSDSNGRFHSDWCSMIYSRLLLARNLLTDDGVIFISIDDNEQANLKKICDEVFGIKNFRGLITRSTGTPTGQGNEKLVSEVDYMLLYSRTDDYCLNGLVFSEEDSEIYNLEDEYGKYLNRPLRKTGGEDKREDRPSMFYPIYSPDGTPVYPISPSGYESRWRCSKARYEELVKEHRIDWKKDGNSWKVYQKFYLEGRTKQVSNLWTDLEGNKKATLTVKKLLNENVFDFPKPVEFLKQCLVIASEKNSIIMDFFSGSATTAHAVMQLNAEDGGHRKFIMVQLPEQCDENSEAAKAGYKTICEIGKERIRRAGDKILAEQQAKEKSAADKTDLFDSTSDKPAAAKPLDIGFRVLKIDDSNMKDVYYSAGEISQQDLVEQISNIKDGRTDMDLLFGCLVDWGVPLSLPIKTETIENLQVYNVNDGDLVACFANDIPEAAIRQIAAVKPLRAVFRDSSFKSDSAKINVTEIFKTISPNTTVKVV
ncbi:site-specific DNA-methyltransferase [Fibrobacter sp.]|uniref:site-specific DNA-methyltransferase n=1 Tax=Fibrobacter sp. TaxID=35828 RepID=UPI0038910D13